MLMNDHSHLYLRVLPVPTFSCCCEIIVRNRSSAWRHSRARALLGSMSSARRRSVLEFAKCCTCMYATPKSQSVSALSLSRLKERSRVTMPCALSPEWKSAHPRHRRISGLLDLKRLARRRCMTASAQASSRERRNPRM